KSVADISRALEDVSFALKKLAADSDLGLIVQNGIVASIAGRPNVGKSSLMNELTRVDRVIVTPHPGTTRDVVEALIQVRGIPVRLQDTAGIQNTKDPIEKEGIDRSRRAVGGADLVLYVLDSSADMGREDEELIRDLKDRNKIFVLNKTDLPARIDRLKLRTLDPEAPIVDVSCADHRGVDELETAIFGLMSRTMLSPSGTPFVSTVRQKECLERALQGVLNARDACDKGLSPELIAVDMRLAIDGLGALTGEVYTDDILEALFSRFCIGK
ncbi:MAG TPA: GTPase, partial [Candidatus Omnitrophota bacterium]|nr:GTPase [Candidatus Omnitrophota bacterium]